MSVGTIMSGFFGFVLGKSGDWIAGWAKDAAVEAWKSPAHELERRFKQGIVAWKETLSDEYRGADFDPLILWDAQHAIDRSAQAERELAARLWARDVPTVEEFFLVLKMRYRRVRLGVISEDNIPPRFMRVGSARVEARLKDLAERLHDVCTCFPPLAAPATDKRLQELKSSGARLERDMRSLKEHLGTTPLVPRSADLSMTLSETGIAKYRGLLAEECDRLPLSSMAKYGQEEGLSVGLRQIFVAPELEYGWPFGDLSAPDSGDEGGEEELRRREEIGALVIDVRDPWPFVMGAPGAGKSTILRWLCASPEALAGSGAPPVPVIVELAGFHGKAQARTAGPYTFFDYLDERMAEDHRPFKPGDLEALAEEGRIFWCFDGLDEVADAQARVSILRRIRGLSDKYVACRGVVTCRVAAAQALRNHLAPAGEVEVSESVASGGRLTPWVLRPFDRPRIDAYLDRWHAAAFAGEPAVGGQRRERIAQALDRSPALLQLAGTPLLLTFLALLNRGQVLPVHRHELFRDFLDLMTNRWDANEHQRSDRFTVSDRRRFLRALAWRLIEDSRDGNPRNAIAYEDLSAFTAGFCRNELDESLDEANSTAEALLRQIRERDFILARRGDGAFAFVQKGLFEFSVADAICARLADQQLTIDYVKALCAERWRDESWGEILRMVGAILAESEPRYAVAMLQAVWTTSKPYPLDVGLAVAWSVRFLAGLENLESGPVRGLLSRLRPIVEHISLPAIPDLGADWLSWVRVAPRIQGVLRPVGWPYGHHNEFLYAVALAGADGRPALLRTREWRHHLAYRGRYVRMLGPWSAEERSILAVLAKASDTSAVALRELAQLGVEEARVDLQRRIALGADLRAILHVLMQSTTPPELKLLAETAVLDFAERNPRELLCCFPSVVRELTDVEARAAVLDVIEGLFTAPSGRGALPENIGEYGARVWLDYLVVGERREALFDRWAALLTDEGPDLQWLQQLITLADSGSELARAERGRLVRECSNYGFKGDAATIGYFLRHVEEPLPVDSLLSKVKQREGVDLSLVEAVIAREPDLDEAKLEAILGKFSLDRRHLHHFYTPDRPWLQTSAEAAAIAACDFRWLRMNLAADPLGDERVAERLELLRTNDLRGYVRAVIDLGVPESVGEAEREALLKAGDDALFNVAYAWASETSDLAMFRSLGQLQTPPVLDKSNPHAVERDNRRKCASYICDKLKLAALVDALLREGRGSGNVRDASLIGRAQHDQASGGICENGAVVPSERLRIVLEFARANDAGDPHAFRFAPQIYLVRGERGEFSSAEVDWSREFVEDLKALSLPGWDPAAQNRLGVVLRRILEPAGWHHHEEAIVDAVAKGWPVSVTVRSAAAELYALPWELLLLRSTGQSLGAVDGVLLRYEWPASRTMGSRERSLAGGGRILVAWSAAGGVVPAAEHVAALRKAYEDAGREFDEKRDVLDHASIGRLADVLAEAEGDGEVIDALHLLCHGGAAGSTFGLVFDGEGDGLRSVVDPSRIQQLLAPHAGMLRLVVVAACHSGNAGNPRDSLGSVAQMLHRVGIAAVVASRYPLSSNGSTRLSEVLYRELITREKTLEEAFVRARTALARDPMTLDWASVQLYARADDGDATMPLGRRVDVAGGAGDDED